MTKHNCSWCNITLSKPFYRRHCQYVLAMHEEEDSTFSSPTDSWMVTWVPLLLFTCSAGKTAAVSGYCWSFAGVFLLCLLCRCDKDKFLWEIYMFRGPQCLIILRALIQASCSVRVKYSPRFRPVCMLYKDEAGCSTCNIQMLLKSFFLKVREPIWILLFALFTFFLMTGRPCEITTIALLKLSFKISIEKFASVQDIYRESGVDCNNSRKCYSKGLLVVLEAQYFCKQRMVCCLLLLTGVGWSPLLNIKQTMIINFQVTLGAS